MHNWPQKLALSAVVILCGAISPRSSFAQESPGDSPVAPIVEKLNACLKEGNVPAFAALLTQSTGQLFLALDAAAKKATTARSAVAAALKDKFHTAERETTQADFSSIFRRLDKVSLKSQTRVDADNFTAELDFYWKDAPRPLGKQIKIVKESEAWKLETAIGPTEDLAKATEQTKKLIERYEKFAAASDQITSEIRAGKYNSALAARAAWQQATYSQPSHP
jgi:hypothetical protein